jgi:hypothetical protein
MVFSSPIFLDAVNFGDDFGYAPRRVFVGQAVARLNPMHLGTLIRHEGKLLLCFGW